MLTSQASAADVGDGKLFTALLAPSGATVYQIKSNPSANAFVAEFNPYNARVGNKKPKLGLQTLVSDQYAIVAYYVKGRCQFVSGGSRSDQNRSNWALNDCSGNAIDKSDSRIHNFVLETLRYLVFVKSTPTQSPPNWVAFDETISSFAIGDVYAAQVGNTDWEAMEAYALRGQGDPASFMTFVINLVNKGRVRTVMTDNNKIFDISDESLINDESPESLDNYSTSLLNKTTMQPLADEAIPNITDENLTPEQEAREAKKLEPQLSINCGPCVLIPVALAIARVAPVIIAGGAASYRYAPVVGRTAARARGVYSKGDRAVSAAGARVYISSVGRVRQHNSSFWRACAKRSACQVIQRNQVYKSGRRAAGSKFMNANRSHFADIFGHQYCAFRYSSSLGRAVSTFSQIGCDVLHSTAYGKIFPRL